jgi:hypothetical protein
MKNNHTPTPWIISTDGTYLAYYDENNKPQQIAMFIKKENGHFAVTACNTHNVLKAENTLLKEVNEAQIFTIEKYQKENEELTTQLAKANSDKERLGELLKVEYNTCIEKANGWGQVGEEELQKNRLKQADEILQTLQDCGITL